MAYIDEWRHWHAARAEALAAPYGPLSAMCGIRVRGSAGVAPYPDDVHQIQPSSPVGSDLAHTWDDRLIRVPLCLPNNSVDLESLTPQQRNLIDAEGVFALDAIEDRIHRITFGGLEVFEPHYDWVLPATVVELEPDRVVRTVAPCTDGHERWIILDALIQFEIDGRRFELIATHEPRGAFHAIFRDATRGMGYPFRNIHVPAPVVGNETTIDFNRAVLPLAALSTRFPAVSAPPRNQLDVAVTAGEHRPYLDGGHPATEPV
ncbi:DUF1684 domain-containing protein [Acrocarpospora catenulata]|uniref:DUF1684 domain-containing protein n=1 Tax=Acrocarpospora catenulata TaxID=2836182 RepID=UPI001BDA47A4|nr:DUF1684 domain-containing protein [Acrocarpospora catenulata]